jgi:hypothetical protein
MLKGQKEEEADAAGGREDNGRNKILERLGAMVPRTKMEGPPQSSRDIGALKREKMRWLVQGQLSGESWCSRMKFLPYPTSPTLLLLCFQ